MSLRHGVSSLSAALLLLLAAAAGARPRLPPGDLARMERGETLLYSLKVAGSGVTMGKAVRIIKDTPEAVLHVLLDVPAYRHFLPRIKDARITRRAGAHVFAVIETDFPWPVKDAWVYIKNTTTSKPGRVHEARWSMLNGTMKTYSGYALVEPWTPDGKQTVLTYVMQAEPKTSTPDSMISNGVQKIVRICADRFALRLEALRKFGKLPKNL
jgi:ribosome-associated toxin RatA of RatAB toxin-antitoxin module